MSIVQKYVDKRNGGDHTQLLRTPNAELRYGADLFPFIKISAKNGAIEVEGSPHAAFGVRIPGASAGLVSGIYGEWAWDGQELTVNIDPLGFKSLYYYASTTQVVVSVSPLQAIAAGVSPMLDIDALSVFYRIGWFLGDETPFKQLRVLLPGGSLRWSAKGWRVTSTGIHAERCNIDSDDAVTTFASLFRKSVGDCLRVCEQPLLLPLSGGRDSRHILFELAKQKRLPDLCVTYSRSPRIADNECAAATSVAQAVGAHHELLPRRVPRIRDSLHTFGLTHLCTEEHAQTIPLRLLCMRQAYSVFDGIGGDILSRNKGFSNPELHDLTQRGQWYAAAERTVVGLESILGVPKDSIAQRSRITGLARREATIARIGEYMRTYAGFADPYTAFLFWNRTRREISLFPGAIYPPNTTVLCPYLGLDLVTFMLSLPFEVTRDAKFHDRTIAATFPAYAHVGYDEAFSSMSRCDRQPLWEQLFSVVDGVDILRKAGLAPAITWAVSEIAQKLRLRRREPFTFAAYSLALQFSSSAAGARRFLNVIAECDRALFVDPTPVPLD